MKRFVQVHRVAIMVSAAAAIAVVVLAAMLWMLRPRFTDSDLAYCLSSQQRSELVDAAVALGLAQRTDGADRLRVGNQEIPVEQWRGKDFQRACLALNPPRRPGLLEQESSIGSGLIGILGVVAGSAIYYISERARDRTQRRGENARRLNELGTAFVAAVENYVRQRSAAIPPERFDIDQVRARRNELVSELYLVRVRHPGWDAPNAPLTALRDALSDRLTDDWGDPNSRANELIAAVDQLVEQISVIAVELERGGPSSTVARR